MLPINDSRISKVENKFKAACTNCSKVSLFANKDGALKMLERGSCRNCKKDYRALPEDLESLQIYQNSEGKWCSTCSGCGKEQAYTRKDHAKQSSAADWHCRSCVIEAGKLSNSRQVGDKQRLFNKFKKSAVSRGLEWSLSLEELFSVYRGKCNLTGWEISISYKNTTASLDRIDSSKGYTLENIQWVHCMVNMCKNKYPEEEFIKMCKAVANNFNT